MPAGNAVAPYLWLCNSSWYTQPTSTRRFVLIDRTPLPGNFTEEQVQATMGTPAEEVTVGAYRVLVFDAGANRQIWTQ
jgi:hypothetical protein